MKSLRDIHEEQKGKSSDKWDLYLNEYGQIFAKYRSLAVDLLEIGIQNGGSLEVWARYFSESRNIIGCDINPDCANLIFDDPRITVIIGDANHAETRGAILTKCPQFDIVIDDGSHTSGDIIRSFLLYFSRVKDGGIYVAEDLHCSYWLEFEGGIFNPYSSIHFFKAFVDVINHEHWGVDREVSLVLRSIASHYGLEIDPSLLDGIHAVRFVNSLCIIEKRPTPENRLGVRNISGTVEQVVIGNLALKGQANRPLLQDHNPWSTTDKTPEEWREEAIQLINRQTSQIDNLNKISEEKDSFIETQRNKNNSLEKLIADKETQLNLILNSRSWKLTKPLRGAVNAAKQLLHPSPVPVVNNNLSPAATNKDFNSAANSKTLLDTALATPIGSAPSFHALSGFREEAHSDDKGMVRDHSKLIAFYLPQFHRIKENSEWWGPGFTEWTNASKGRPNFDGHIQPHIPRELGYYDLSRLEVMQEQTDLARQFGVYGFCFYYYWFSGRKILEKPLENFLDSNIDFPFCICWANENWTRTWDGKERDVLIEQKYQDDDEEKLIESLLPYLEDPRYIRVDGKPLLMVYRIKELPDPSRSIQRWKEAAKRLGLSGLHLSVVDFYDIEDPREVGADALVEFPPHKFNGPQNKPNPMPVITNPDFRGGLIDYTRMMAQSAYRDQPDYCLYRGIIPGWDNTARRQDTGTIVVGSNPELYGAWLSYLRSYTRVVSSDTESRFIFVNAWNEWGEGCHLEPDLVWGTRFLEETERSSWYDSKLDELALEELRRNFFNHINVISNRQHKSSPINLEGYRPPSSFARRIGQALQDYPLLHRLSKFVYSTFISK